MSLVVVRHAEPQVSSADDPRLWPLSKAGRAAARRLVDQLPRTGLWLSSTECKARETLQYAAEGDVAVTEDPRFDEVHRDEPFDSEFRARRRAWVEGRLDERHAGWESPKEAAERFELAVHEYAEAADTLVIATHGMVLTAWLVHAQGRLSLPEAGSFWEHLRFPDVIEVGREGRGRPSPGTGVVGP